MSFVLFTDKMPYRSNYEFEIRLKNNFMGINNFKKRKKTSKFSLFRGLFNALILGIAIRANKRQNILIKNLLI